jgi:hypothetical protein
VKAEIAQLEQALAVLEYKCWYYETAEAAGSEDAVRKLIPDQVPEQVRAGHEILGA